MFTSERERKREGKRERGREGKRETIPVPFSVRMKMTQSTERTRSGEKPR
jgi:hypothetical protein